VDAARVYLTGLSMGGYGSWALLAKAPERFAAVAPICGGGNTVDYLLVAKTKSAALKATPVWAFHGAKDPVVLLSESERIIALLKKLGATGKTLVVDVKLDDNFSHSARNIAGVKLVASGRLTARDVMNTDTVIATKAAVERLQEVLG